MSTPHVLIADAAAQLAAVLPGKTIASAAEAIASADWGQWDSARSHVLQGVAPASARQKVEDFLDTWELEADGVPPVAIAMALTTAARAESANKAAQSVELVWTGPDVKVVPVRRTRQALLQVIGAAKRRLLIVSYAVYNIPHVCKGLVEAADSGVDIRLVLETPNLLDGQNTYDTIRALGPGVAERCSVFFWPSENRKAGADGKLGILHVKAAVADGHRLFLSSANLTEYAFTLNMELGVLIKGGHIPGDIDRHFDRLIEERVLVPVELD